MSRSSTPSKRFRYMILAEELRREIEQGVYPVGGKLPSERALAQKYDVTHITIRQSFDVLARQGLVVRTPGSGTYVNALLEKPIIAILFGPKMTEESAHFYRALLSAAERCITALSCRCRSYDGFNLANVEVAEQHPSYQALLSDARHHPVKAYIKVSVDDPRWCDLQPLRNLPFATFGLLKSDFTHDYYGFAEDCIDYAVSRGFSRIVYFRCFSSVSHDLRGFKDGARRANLPMPECIQLEDHEGSFKSDATAHLKMRELTHRWKRTNDWPDAIIVSDDIAARGVALGLIEAGAEAVARVTVITHVNEGIEHHYGIPIIRYAFSPAEVAQVLCDRLQERMDDPDLPATPQTALRGKLLDSFNPYTPVLAPAHVGSLQPRHSVARTAAPSATLH